MKENAFMNWSGGKDSALCLYKALQAAQYNIKYLLTSVNKIHNRISMHGVRRELLQAQAKSIDIQLTTIELPEEPSMNEYEEAMLSQVNALKQNGCSEAIFGDIFLEDLKLYREEKLRSVGIDCMFPLWKIDTTQLIKEFIESGFKAIVVCVNEEYLDRSFCGRLIDASFINDLPANVDVCGENGEFHSFVFNGPIFKEPISFAKGEIVYKEYKSPGNNAGKYGFYFCDLLPV